MRFPALLKAFLCLALAASAAGAWNLHIMGTRHEAGENCEVCAITTAPEFNSDCGSNLLVCPDDFVLLKPEAPLLTVAVVVIPSFNCRAPPAV